MRRTILFSLLALPLFAFPAWAATGDSVSPSDAVRLLKQGGVALLLRHGQTEPGIGDPPGFTLDNCKSQRNLSSEGRAQVRAMAARARTNGVRFARVYTSQWCRCHETAQLLSESKNAPREWPVLNSQFAGNPVAANANEQIVGLLRTAPANESWLLVTHQVNIASLTGISLSSGEGVLVRVTDGGLAVLGRVTL